LSALLSTALKSAIIALQASQEAQGRAVAAVGALLVRGVDLASDPSDPQHRQMQRAAASMSEWAADMPDSTAPQHVLVDQLEAFKQNNAPAASIRAVAYEAAFKEHSQVVEPQRVGVPTSCRIECDHAVARRQGPNQMASVGATRKGNKRASAPQHSPSFPCWLPPLPRPGPEQAARQAREAQGAGAGAD
jgi:hypothetical protein